MENSHVLQITERHFSDLYLCFCGLAKCEPNHSFGPGIRDNYIIHYITKGKGKYYVNNACYELSQGQGFLVEPHLQVFYQADKDDPWQYIWIGFNGTKAIQYLNDIGLSSNHLKFQCNYSEELKQIVHNMLKNNNFATSNQFLLESLLYSFFSILSKDIKTILPTNDNNNLYVKKAIEFIENNYTNNLKITDIAKYVCITRNYLYLLFRKHLNISPQEYLANYRITRAEQLLNTTTLSIETISNSCGYQDPLVFAKAFKAKKGFTPSQYRKSFSPKISFNKPVNRMK